MLQLAWVWRTSNTLVSPVSRLKKQMPIDTKFLVLGLMLALTACSKPGEEPKRADSPSNAESPAQAVDACALLTAEEVQRIQGAAVEQITPSVRTSDGIAVSQCYIKLPTGAASLSLAVMQRSGNAAASTPRTLWEETFHLEKPKRIGRDGQEKKRRAPEKIDGIGDEAFWAGGRFGGTMHVLKGETSFTLSIGGPAEEAVMVQKLKDLAMLVASRL